MYGPAVLDQRLNDLDHLDTPVLYARGHRRQRHFVGIRWVAPAVGQILPLLHPLALLVHIEDARAILHRQALGASLIRLGQAQQLWKELDPVRPAVWHHPEGVERPWYYGIAKPAAVDESAGHLLHIAA